ncbi:MAG: Uma2 family endonuclease [Minicystis sp.]
MAEGDPHLDAKMGIRNTLRSHYGKRGRRIYVGADIKVYYPGQKGFTPDVIAVIDADPRSRDCWMVSQEGKGVDLAFEVHYKGDRKKDFVTNVKKFAALGIREYFIYDINRAILRAHRLPRPGAPYELIAPQAGRFRSTVLDLEVSLEKGVVRFYKDGAMLVSEPEMVDKLEQMIDAAVTHAQEQEARAQEQEARAQEQEARAQQAVARLGTAVVTILTVRGIEVTPEARDRILSCSDVATLERWLQRAATVNRAEDLLASG